MSECRPRGVHRRVTTTHIALPFATATAYFHIHSLSHKQTTQTQQNPQILSAMLFPSLSPPRSKRFHNWFDRLRFKKGFPTGEDIDLGSFLLNNPQNSLAPRPDNNSTRTHTHTRSPEPHDPTLTTVLAHLFKGKTFPHTIPYRKVPRKQPHPKIFIPASSSSSAVTPAAAPSDVAVVQTQEEDREETLDRAENEENDDEGNELKGFSKSEVTVIDTSSPGWKADKYVFRKLNVWKLGDKKPKSKFFSKQKKSNDTLIEANGVDDENEIGTAEDTVINLRGEKPVKTHKTI